jgi:hypothetical protein
VQVLAVDNVYTSPTVGKNVNITYGQNTDGPDTDATLPVPTQMLAVQIEDFRAQLSVFPHGSRGPRGHILLEEIEKELLLRNTDWKLALAYFQLTKIWTSSHPRVE